MDPLQAIFLGMIQGLVEWLPLSSKSQIMLAAGLMGISPEKALAIGLYLHIGTFFAAIVFFRKELAEIARKALARKGTPLLVFLIVATISTALVGLPLFLLLRHEIPQMGGELFSSLIGLGLIATGVVLLKAKSKGKRKQTQATNKDAVIAGAAQGFSVLPGISRSGITSAPLLWLGFTQDSALKLSFLMSIPAVAGAEIGFSLLEGLPEISPSESILLIASSFLFGLLSIQALIAVAKKVNFGVFCISLGAVALLPMALSLIF
jgi:undecaprenyl-diphosphatase